MALTGAPEQPGNFLGKRRRYSKDHLQIKGGCERGLFPLSCPGWLLPHMHSLSSAHLPSPLPSKPRSPRKGFGTQLGCI